MGLNYEVKLIKHLALELNRDIFDRNFYLYKMTKLSLLALFLFLAFSMNAQVSFYLRPTVNMKTNSSNYDIGNFNNFSNFSNRYFTFVSNRIFFDNNVVNLGLHIGVQVNKKHFFELGYSQDNSGIAVSVLGQSYLDNYLDYPSMDEFSSPKASYSYSGSPHARFSLTYSNSFWVSKNGMVQLRGIVGLGLLHNKYVNRKKMQFNEQYISSFALGQMDEDIYIVSHEERVSHYIRNSFYMNLGLGIDFYTKRNNIHIFSFDITYLQGTKFIQYSDHVIQVMDNNEEINFHYGLGSRSSGIYFTLSRRFQVYPWIPLSKKKRTAGLL